MPTKHYENDRKTREKIINDIGYGKPVKMIEVDDGHKNGAVEQTLTTTGIIIIRNKRTRKIVTKLIARPGQLKRFFENEIPEYLVKLAKEHQSMGYNFA